MCQICMKLIIIIIFFLTDYIFCQNQGLQEIKFINEGMLKRIEYIKNPDSTDIICIREINRAKNDVEKGKIVFTQKYGFLYGQMRYEKELQELCVEAGLIYMNERIPDFVLSGQTYCCYGDYMDCVLCEKYGVDFKNNLHEKADSLFLINSLDKVVSIDDCDEKPRPTNFNYLNSRPSSYVTVDNPNFKYKKNKNGEAPFMHLIFIVNKDSSISSIRLKDYSPLYKENEPLKEELFNIAVNAFVTEYPKWIPGKIKSTLLKTEDYFTVFFRK